MLRTLFFFAALIGIGLAVDYGSQEPGYVLIRWHGYEVELTAVLLSIAVATLALTVFILTRLLDWLDRLPHRLEHWRNKRRQQSGFQYLLESMDAYAAGDFSQARRLSKRAGRMVPKLPLATMVQAEAARAAGKTEESNKYFEKLALTKSASFLGLKGLIDDAIRHEDWAGAAHLLEKAIEQHPKSGWLWERLVDVRSRVHNVDGAFEALQKLKKSGAVPKTKTVFMKACLHHAKAADMMNKGALEEALKETRLGRKTCDRFLPLFMLESDIRTAQGDTGRAARVLMDGFKTVPRSQVATKWMDTYAPNFDSHFVKAAEKFVKPHKDTAIGRMVMADACRKAGEYIRARKLLLKVAEQQPSRDVYRRLAHLERELEPNTNAAQKWLEKALDAEVWIETGGYIEEFKAWQERGFLSSRPGVEGAALPLLEQRSSA